MTRCVVSWCIEHSEEPWPGGDWQQCRNDATTFKLITLTEDSIVMLYVCEAHQELVDAVSHGELS